VVRIIDKDTRLIDIDFGPVASTVQRNPLNLTPSAAQGSLNGMQQIIRFSEAADPLPGSFVQYQHIDLSFMTNNNEVMQPVEISVQRTSPVPLGFQVNGNTWDQIEEYIYIFTRPLNNELIRGIPPWDDFRELGLDRSQTVSRIGGQTTGIPSHEQTVYAEKRMYSYSTTLGASVANGELEPDIIINPDYFSIYGMPVLDSVTNWGTMSSITGPSLHCYRVVINRTQQMFDGAVLAVPYEGNSSLRFPPLNVTLLCKDPNLTEGQYLTRLSNAMASNSSLRFPPLNVTLLCKDPNLTEGQYLTRLSNAMASTAEDGPVGAP